MNDPKLRRKFQQKFAQKVDQPNVRPGVLGNGLGVVSTGEGNRVFVRINDIVTTAISESVEHRDDLQVWVGYDIYDPSTLRVLRERDVSGTGGVSVIGAHAPTHAYGGRDPVKVDTRQLMQLRMYVIASGLYTIGVVPGTIYIDNMPKLIGTDNLDGTYTHATIDLITHMVTTADKARFVLVTIDNTGALVATAGSEVDIDALDFATDMPLPPAGWRYVLGAVRLFAGQLEILEHAENNDYLDFRWPIPHTHVGDELGLDIDDIEDVVITDVVDGEVLVSESGDWVNQTLAEAGISAVGHDHDSDYAPISHVSDTNNPHSVTATQVGLGSIVQDLIDHETDTNNPHQVTAAQMSTRWEVLTNGNPANPELMFDENGDVLYVEVS